MKCEHDWDELSDDYLWCKRCGALRYYFTSIRIKREGDIIIIPDNHKHPIRHTNENGEHFVDGPHSGVQYAYRKELIRDAKRVK